KKLGINHQSNSGRTVFAWAVEYGWVELIDLLLAHRADYNITDNEGFHPMNMAVKKHNKDVIEILYKQDQYNVKY
ncbi:MAG: ankyrin repeat domain-containing protein, partial [Rickettsiaceae bacterium]|nr:ankyrin repeat domain-containing protein [Rickettsiaceae bacterium]